MAARPSEKHTAAVHYFWAPGREETGVSACGGRNLLKGAMALYCSTADGAKILHGVKK